MLVFSKTQFVLEETRQETSCYPETICPKGSVNSLSWFAMNQAKWMHYCRFHRPLLLSPLLVLADFCSHSPGDLNSPLELSSLWAIPSLTPLIFTSFVCFAPKIPTSQPFLNKTWKVDWARKKARKPASVTFWKLPFYLPYYLPKEEVWPSMTQS